MSNFCVQKAHKKSVSNRKTGLVGPTSQPARSPRSPAALPWLPSNRRTDCSLPKPQRRLRPFASRHRHRHRDEASVRSPARSGPRHALHRRSHSSPDVAAPRAASCFSDELLPIMAAAAEANGERKAEILVR